MRLGKRIGLVPYTSDRQAPGYPLTPNCWQYSPSLLLGRNLIQVVSLEALDVTIARPLIGKDLLYQKSLKPDAYGYP